MLFSFIKAGLIVLIGLALLKTCGTSLNEITNSPAQVIQTQTPSLFSQLLSTLSSADPGASFTAAAQQFFAAFKANFLSIWAGAKAAF